MAQSLKARTAIPEDLGSVPSTYMAAHNPWQLQCQGIHHPFLATVDIACIYEVHRIHADKNKK